MITLREKRSKVKEEKKTNTLIVINELYQLLNKKIPLPDLLEEALNLIISLKIIGTEENGSITIYRDNSTQILANTDEAYFNYSTDRLISIPIVFCEEIIGMLNLYLNKKLKKDHLDGHQLSYNTITNVLASIIIQGKKEEDIQQSKNLAEKYLNINIQRLYALQHINYGIISDLNSKDIFNMLLKEVVRQLGVDAANVLIYDNNTELLTWVDGIGFHTKALQYTKLKVGEGLAGKSLLDKKAVEINDLTQNPEYFNASPDFKKEGFSYYLGIPLIVLGNIEGVLELYNRSTPKRDKEWFVFLETLADYGVMAIKNIKLINELKHTNNELRYAYDKTLESWSKIIDMRDSETEGHSQRVSDMVNSIALKMDINEPNLIYIRRGALLHDIGKLAIPDNILLKPGKLNDEEWQIMRKHPVYAFEFLSSIEFLNQSIDIPYYHHEKWNGTGYPKGLKGKAIPLSARIFAVVDVWDALSSDRPYRSAWPREKVKEYIRSQSGTHFDPDIVTVFIELI